MEYSNLSDKNKMLLDHLQGQTSIPILEHQLTNSLREGTKASVAVAFGLISKATLFTQEMGIGKTYVAMALIENILRGNPNQKVMFCGTNDKLNEYVKLFKENLSPGFTVTHTTAGEREVRRAFRDLDTGAQVLICTHSVWDKGHVFHREFIQRLEQFQGFILDEGGMLLKNADNYSYRMMEQFVPEMKYRYILNATPIEKDLSLLINQCRILGIPIPSRSALYSKYGSLDEEFRWIFGDLGELRTLLRHHVFNVSRVDIKGAGTVKYIVDTKFLKPTIPLQRLISQDGARNLRFPFLYPDSFTPENYPSLRVLVDTCVKGKSKGEKMLVFVRNVEPKVRMKQILEELGMSVGIYDGAHTNTQQKKNAVENHFNKGGYDVLLTNKIYGLSLNIVETLIMYDLPSNFYQYVYRAVRDLKDKELRVTPIIYDWENDYNTLKEELLSEQYQNEFSERGFDLVQQIVGQLNYKSDNGEYS